MGVKTKKSIKGVISINRKGVSYWYARKDRRSCPGKVYRTAI